MLKFINEKIKLRKKFLKKRSLISNRFLKEEKINQNLCDIFSSINLVTSLYYSVRFEVNLKKISNFMHANKRKVVLPIIINKKSHLLFREWRRDDELKKDFYDIMVPKNGYFLEPKVLLIPMLAFDLNKNRLGYGGGFYDRTISFLENKNKILKFGIAFDEQESTIIPVDKNDKKMDAIITQTRIIT